MKWHKDPNQQQHPKLKRTKQQTKRQITLRMDIEP